MASQAQILANRQNAQQSTGPLTPEGKARSSQNARKHGLTAQELIVRDDEREAYASLEADLVADLKPQGALEDLVFNQLLHAAWNQRRLRRLEAELFHHNLDPLANPTQDPILDRYARYQARFDRAFTRALRELKSLQTERAQRAAVYPDAASALPPLASLPALTKQTENVDRYDDFTRALSYLRDYQLSLKPKTAASAKEKQPVAA